MVTAECMMEAHPLALVWVYIFAIDALQYLAKTREAVELTAASSWLRYSQLAPQKLSVLGAFTHIPLRYGVKH